MDVKAVPWKDSEKGSAVEGKWETPPPPIQTANQREADIPRKPPGELGWFVKG